MSVLGARLGLGGDRWRFNSLFRPVASSSLASVTSDGSVCVSHDGEAKKMNSPILIAILWN